MSISGFQYYLTMVNQAISFKIVKFLKNKLDAFKQGGEFLNQHFAKLAEVEGFIHVLSPAETPQHNGFAERSNRTILEKARCLLGGSSLPNSYWAEAINTSIFLCNITPTPSWHNNSPHVLWRNTPPRIKRLKTFGCLAIISVSKHHWDWKLSASGEEVLKGQSGSGGPLLVPSMTQGTETVDEISPVLSVVVDEIHPEVSCNSPTDSPHQEGQDGVVDEVQHPSPEAY
ncbi:hypothetical protein O181_033867 [Austropuccinia psidii MF-1]|uniref:Integrase catalytic domain-containing protein n=1 Tax=Austropuccinia psidii MF-1 TaxID=1389203 RepID=A0A9Q3D265_9BASI|nr:hypothetical protein [Austropuccinia psidii MF-1]